MNKSIFNFITGNMLGLNIIENFVPILERILFYYLTCSFYNIVNTFFTVNKTKCVTKCFKHFTEHKPLKYHKRY